MFGALGWLGWATGSRGLARLQFHHYSAIVPVTATC